jgi:hypothetical protein
MDAKFSKCYIQQMYAKNQLLLSLNICLAALAWPIVAHCQAPNQANSEMKVKIAPLDRSIIRPEAIQLQGVEYVIPEVIIGGEWTSTIRITNRGEVPIPTTNVYFWDNNGNPMRATFQTTYGNIVTDSGFSITSAVGGMVEATFIGTSASQFGHATIGCSAIGCGTHGLYAEVTLRNRNSTRPDFESVFPTEMPYALQYMLFDGRNGLSTVLYVVNSSTAANLVSIDVFDTNNNFVRTIPLSFSSLSSQILTLAALAPETIGIQGTLVIRGQNATGLVTVTGLRINPSNSFTPLRAFVPAQ